jgi:hypothetical protein
MVLRKFTSGRLKQDPSLSPSTSSNSKWIKYFNERFEMVKLVQDKIQNTLVPISRYNNFMSRTPIAQQLRQLTNGNS